ncbi:TrmH family RNA methyltransferase [Stackebrandtia albiflava]|uniref:TrmH family RNA methyltransferase n=1 Tax=Stackebrandtia albiflava TaxID=406432 RepID=A0A562V2E1_9ACTN|nr:TrmH family RNA methyltransferase [Stackebrandtia albiflava]TWJ12059.1 TrmH family RNA methyltransferase [Stackebrandtia albiflava]
MTTRNARFQQWQALLTNRAKRQRLGEMLVQGVRPINCARANGWRFSTLLYNAQARLSNWASETLREVDAEQVAVAPDLLAELGDKAETVPELLAVVKLPADDLNRLGTGPDFLGVAFDRPGNPGNIGTLLRSADAFGATAFLTTGHAADPYDPRAVRASTGSVFAVPTVRAESSGQVADWLAGTGVRIVGTDEHAETELTDYDFTRPTLVVVGNETAGMSRQWRDAVDVMLRIPIGGAASSLNAATAGSIVLYEAARARVNGRVPGR